MVGMRIGGLASGMDIDQIVGDLMKAERIPLDKLFTKKTTYEWQRDAFRSFNAKMTNFDTYVFDNFSLEGSFNKKTVTSSNDAKVTATSSSSGTITINSIDNLASAANNARIITDLTKKASTTTMADLGKTTPTTVRLSVIQSDGTMKDTNPDLTFAPTDTIADVVSKINGSNAGVTAFYDEGSGQLSLSTKATGDNAAGAEIIDASASGFFDVFGFTGTELANNGQNAKLTVNGAEIIRNTNNFTVVGFNISLKELSVGTPITLTSDTDVESMVTKIKEFVEKYNELIGGMNEQLKEKKYRDFPPLTDEQRKDMSEKEQELWDEKAKSGILRNDPILSNGLSDLRNSLYGRVSGLGDNVVDTLAEMGITTSPNYNDGGKLIINETKLREAIAANPENISKTFSQSGEVTATGDTRGIAQRMRESMKKFINNIEEKAGKPTYTDQQYTIGESLINTNESIRNFQNRLKDIESRYWRQFTAMEKAISQANQQSAFLMGQMGGQ